MFSASLRVRTQFLRETEYLAALVEKRLEAQIDMLLAIDRFTTLVPRFTRQEFASLVTPLLSQHPGTLNFTWNPYVSADERDAFERGVRTTDVADFRVLQRNEDEPLRTARAESAGEHLPILYVEPLESNATVVGLDPLTVRTSVDAISATRSDGKPHASEGFLLTQEQGQQRGIVIYQAIFDPPWLNQGSPRFKGLVSSAFRMEDTVAATLDDMPARRLVFCLVDLDATEANRRLAGQQDCDAPGWSAQQRTSAFPMQFAQRSWEIRFAGTSDYGEQLRTLAAWSSVAIGALGTGFLGAFLLMTTGQARRIATLVDQRTAELATATASLQERQNTLSTAQRIARMGSWELDPARHEVTCSEGLRALLDVPETAVFPLQALIHAIAQDDRPQLERAITSLTRSPGSIALDCRSRGATQRIVHIQIESEADDLAVRRVRGTVQDVTAARKAEADIQQLAHYDALTGLPNRTLWMVRTRGALQSAQRHDDSLAVLFLDLDQFKTVNDSLGHNVGDQLLRMVARRLSGCIRNEDLLARLGGDEFVALLPRLAKRADAGVVARKMLDVLAQPIEIGGHELSLSVSIGIAYFPEDGDDVDTLLKHADTAMYSAKNAGRNNFQHFVATMNSRALERLVLEGGLRRAIERSELVLHFQPQFNTRTQRLSGAEALVRWNHPEQGMVMPDRFIPIAEDSGLIVPLGSWVLRAACAQQAHWRAQGHRDLLVAINVSAHQFNRNDFVDHVRDVLAETGADPRSIELEITESALIRPSAELFDRLHQLRDLGLTLALDDFGTGYSSLSYLQRLPISRLKLDRSFVKDLPGDAEDAAIASAAMSMARDLGIEVVAEGVETLAQKRYLASRGCTLMQGYLFAPALPLEAFDERYPPDDEIA